MTENRRRLAEGHEEQECTPLVPAPAPTSSEARGGPQAETTPISRATPHHPAPILTPWLDDGDVQLYHGDALAILASLPAGSAQMCVTSPPYWGLRDYGADGQLGLESSPAEYVDRLVTVFREVRRVLRDDGTLWLNLGDSYAGSGERGNGGNGGLANVPCARGAGGALVPAGGKKREDLRGDRYGRVSHGLKPKDLVGIPWRVAFALQADGWYLRSDIIWSKPNPMPESVTDRPTKAHEYVFLLSKRPRYLWDADAVREPAEWARWGDQTTPKHTDTGASWIKPRRKSEFEGMNGRNIRSVWEIPTTPMPEAHFATFPEALVRPCILAGSRLGDVVLDPFIGSGTTALVARKHGRRCIGIDLNDSYLEIAARRTQQLSLLADEAAS